jgi:tetratricopeptide (TPR) repeat protein
MKLYRLKVKTERKSRTASRMLIPLLMVMCGTFAAGGLPIPESRHEYTGAQRQRIRYANSTLLRQAHERVAREDYTGARTSLEAVLENDPGNNLARVMLINVHNQLEAYGQARQQVEELLTHYPDFLELYLERAYIHLHEDQNGKAIGDLEYFLTRAPAGHPRRGEALDNLAGILFRERRFDEAARVMRNRLEDGDTVARRLFLAECAFMRKQPADALPDLNAALALNPASAKQAEILDRIGFIHYELEQYNDAAGAFEQALHHAEDEAVRAGLLLKLGYTWFQLEAFDRADAALAAAQTHYREPPELPAILYQRGIVAYRDGRPGAAARFYAHRLAYGFDEAIAFAQLDALQKAGDLAGAIQAAHAFEARNDATDAFRWSVMERRMNWHILRNEHEAVHEAALQLFRTLGNPGFFGQPPVRRSGPDNWKTLLRITTGISKGAMSPGQFWHAITRFGRKWPGHGKTG